MLGYLIWVKPFDSKGLNRLEIFNEACLLMARIHVHVFTGFVADPWMRYQVGWSLVILTVSNLIVNMLIMLKSMLCTFYDIIKLLRKKCYPKP